MQIDMDRLRQRCYPFWVAPEVLHGQAPSTSSDVYALGVLIYEMLYRREPFNGEDPDVSYPSYHVTCNTSTFRSDQQNSQKLLHGSLNPVQLYLQILHSVHAF